MPAVPLEKLRCQECGNDPLENIKIRSVIGGPAPEEVKRMITSRKDRLNAEKQRVEVRKRTIEKGEEALDLAVKEILEP